MGKDKTDNKQDDMNDLEEQPFRSGFVGIVGQANAGKSTLMNRLVGAKVAIVSDKPQTTRYRMLGIVTGDDHQICFVDMPGILSPRDKLNEALIDQARRATEDLDLALHLVDATETHAPPDELSEILAAIRAPKFLVLNKIDALGREGVDPAALEAHFPRRDYAATFSISALTGEGCPALLEAILAHLPDGPAYFDEDDLTDRDMRFVAAEVVREKAFELLGEEVPYSIATRCEEFRERPDGEGKTLVRVVIYVERQSQKQIVIGRKGAMIRRIGAEARREIEDVFGAPIYLDLWVKVRKNWRKKETELKRFGLKQ